MILMRIFFAFSASLTKETSALTFPASVISVVLGGPTFGGTWAMYCEGTKAVCPGLAIA
jgi:hypothetical protein